MEAGSGRATRGLSRANLARREPGGVDSVFWRRCADRPEASIPCFLERVGGEGLQEVFHVQFGLYNRPLQEGELRLVVAIEGNHLIAAPDDAVIGKASQSSHHASSDAIPVLTSAPQLGHVASAIEPTMNLKLQDSQVILGDGGSGGRGGGGAELAGAGGAPGAPAAARTIFTEPHTGHENRPGPGTSNWVRHEPQRTITRLTLLLRRRLLRWTVDR